MLLSYPTYYYLKVESDDFDCTDSFDNYSQEYLPKDILNEISNENDIRYENYENEFDEIDEEFIKFFLS